MRAGRLAVSIRRIFVAGLLVLGPAALTVLVLLWLFRQLDGVLGPAMTQLTGREIPGLGVLATIGIVFILGIVSRNVLGGRLVGAVEQMVGRVPVARSLYGSTKEVVSSLADRPADAFRRVVLIEYPRREIWSLGFVTGSVAPPAGVDTAADLLTIFVPSTPNPTSGYVVLVPRADATDLPITVEQGVRLVISGGILRPSSWNASAKPTEPG